MPASPSSVMMVPAVRGGRASAVSTAVQEPDLPTWAASTPMSARLKVVMVFFLAAIMPLKFGYRGSLIWSVTETTAGSVASMVSAWVSPSRRAVSLPASSSRDAAKVTCGRPSRSASCAGTSEVLIAEVHAFRGADLKGLLHRIDCPGRTHAQRNDLVAGRFPAAGLGQLQRSFQGVFIQFGQDAFGAVHRVGLTCEVTVELRIRDVLDQHNDFQSLFHCVYSSLPCGWTAAPDGVMATECPAAGLFLANHIAAGQRG